MSHMGRGFSRIDQIQAHSALDSKAKEAGGES